MSGNKKGGNKKGPSGGDDKKFEFNFAKEGGQEERKSVLDLAGKDAHILSAMQGKLGQLIGKSSGYMETLSKPVQDRIKALKKIQHDQSELQDEFEKQVQELQKKFDAQVKPLYDRRSAIVKGDTEPSEDELKFVEEGAAEPNPNVPPVEDKGEKGIPQFWLTALQHNPVFLDLITEKDEEVLKSLIDVREVHIEDEPDSFRLEFHFTPNEYFEDTVLFKTYHVTDDDDEPLKLEASKINWKTGKNITVKIVKVQQGGGRGKRGGRGRGGKQGGGKPQTIQMEKRTESFFNWFTEDPLEGLDLEEEEDFDPEEIVGMDYDIGVELKDEIIPQAVLWFTGEAEISGPGMDSDDEGGFLDEEGDEEGDDDFEPPRDANGKPVENPQECKQQ
eukprot:TRINITY_DN19425_c0_g1_i1.p1 TRINITY_DN19425_c0_g1~~TRINITY_DN19425_c0_g1_i1.p1  ORF type:complete len:389 (-),score=148.33 TRINITY_DN19425_c0_g1_i1:42-1208(-)